MSKVSLDSAFASFSDHWRPRLAAEFNGQSVKLAKVKGEFVWHKHDDADELFFVYAGELRLELRNRTITLGPGEMYVVPRGVEHRPTTDDEVLLVLFEPAELKNTGDANDSELTATEIPRIE